MDRSAVHHTHHEKGTKQGDDAGFKVLRDVLFSSHGDAEKEEQKFERNAKDNRKRLQQARKERELREQAIKGSCRQSSER